MIVKPGPRFLWLALVTGVAGACNGDAGGDAGGSTAADGSTGAGPGPGTNTQGGTNTQTAGGTTPTTDDSNSTAADATDATSDGTATTDTAVDDTGPITPPTTDCPTGYDDPFTGGSLDDCWQFLGGPGAPTQLIDISVPEGSVVLTARNGEDGVWYQGSTKSMVFKLVTGTNWKITATVAPRRRTDAGVPPVNPLHVGGLMVRDPASAGGNTENYIFTMAGSSEFSTPTVEIKSTDDGVSTFAEPDWPNPAAAQLRMCRIGDAFYLYKRVPQQGQWQLSDANNAPAPVMRPDLPETLQLGIALNFSGPQNDLAVAFTDLSLADDAPASEADCTVD